MILQQLFKWNIGGHKSYHLNVVLIYIVQVDFTTIYSAETNECNQYHFSATDSLNYLLRRVMVVQAYFTISTLFYGLYGKSTVCKLYPR